MKKNNHIDTALSHLGCNPKKHDGVVNPPVYHTSTIIFPSLKAMMGQEKVPYEYGRRGTETLDALKVNINVLEQAYDSIICSSGMNAITTAFLSYAKQGTVMLVTDNTYYPVRQFVEKMLRNMGIVIIYYNPMDLNNLSSIINEYKENISFIWAETPGSQTFECCDITAICAMANKYNIAVGVDNTWSGGYFYQPIQHGAALSVQAATKYIVGHSDAMVGTIAVNNEATYNIIYNGHRMLGISIGPDDTYLAIRGVRTLPIRLRHHEQSALKVAAFLNNHPKVNTILHPAFEECPGHELFMRDFTGSSGLFSFTTQKLDIEVLEHMVNNMSIFAMGFSWGGFESLITPCWVKKNRATNLPSYDNEQIFRLQIGLEDSNDLIDDLSSMLERMG